MIKILTLSSLYPNRCEPRHGVFVEHRLRQLLTSGEVTARVVAPVPWFPFTHHYFGKYAAFAAVPRAETRHGIDIIYPRYPVIPKIGMNMAPLLMARAMRPVLRRILASGYDFDLIDAHYFYPDGVAAEALGRWFDKPVVVTARGDDVTFFPKYRLPRRMIVRAARRSGAVVTVSKDLKKRLCAYGVPEEQVTALRNGVDLQFFRPDKREAARNELAIEGPTLLSAGHLNEAKGHHIVIAALASLPDFRLIIIGEGGMKRELERRVRRLGLSNRVRFVGNLSQEKLRTYYSAVDALVLATAREGMPNVVLEAMACATPVVATPVGGIPEVVATPAAGVLLSKRTPEAVVAAVKKLFANYPRPEDTRRVAETFGWEETTRGQVILFEKLLSRTRIPRLAESGA